MEPSPVYVVGLGALIALAGCFDTSYVAATDGRSGLDAGSDGGPFGTDAGIDAGGVDSGATDATAATDGAPGTDSGPGSDAGPCVPGPFGPAVELTALNAVEADRTPFITADGSTLLFTSQRPGSAGWDIWMSTRSGPAAPWTAPTSIVELSSGWSELHPYLEPNGFEIYFSSTRPGGLGFEDIWLATRASVADAFGTPTNVTALSSSDVDSAPELSSDGLTVYFHSIRFGGLGATDLYTATRPSLGAAFGTPTLMANVNSSGGDREPTVTADGLTLIFASNRGGGAGAEDLWMATRPDTASPFSAAVNISELNTNYFEQDPAISPDGMSLYFAGTSPGGTGSFDLFYAERTCN
jgi:Tol biopolymer transport system component